MKFLPIKCPCIKKHSLIKIDNKYSCQNSECIHNNPDMHFPIFKNIPILISESNTDTVCNMKAGITYIDRYLLKYQKFKNFLHGESKTTLNNCLRFKEEIFKISKNPKILIIGGAEKGSGTRLIWANENIEIHSIDIYGSNTVDIICDAHYLPLESEFYDGVWIQGVMNHLVEPIKAAEEIYRVLRKNGIVYAESPFMQQVAEGAFDFNRYTVLGHRYLFKKFESIAFGGNKGPEVVLAWALRYLIWSIFRIKFLARLGGVVLGILLRPLRLFVSHKSLFDASSGVYFLGKKSLNQPISHRDLIKLYKGQF